MDKRASIVVFAAFAIGAVLLLLVAGCGKAERQKNVYPSVDLVSVEEDGTINACVETMGSYPAVYFLIGYREVDPRPESGFTETSLNAMARETGKIKLTRDVGIPLKKGKNYEIYLKYTILSGNDSSLSFCTKILPVKITK